MVARGFIFHNIPIVGTAISHHILVAVRIESWLKTDGTAGDIGIVLHQFMAILIYLVWTVDVVDHFPVDVT